MYGGTGAIERKDGDRRSTGNIDVSPPLLNNIYRIDTVYRTPINKLGRGRGGSPVRRSRCSLGKVCGLDASLLVMRSKRFVMSRRVTNF